MDLEQIQEKLINDFDFDKTLEILTKLGENYTKYDLIENAKNLIKMTYTSREMDDVFFYAAYLVASRAYIEGKEVHYSLNFSIDIQSNVEFDLKENFSHRVVSEKEFILREELSNLLELNKTYFEDNKDDKFVKSNILKIEEILEILD
ncbi:hypothetical protein [Arcobacter caeni]|uniref:Uncharacterized protein n=1 Tax=Arcobacter caeni TaxID=1912877 RepID=A0A363D5I1_9BACT|nr:hypothetical protein [Arcobacter caeni]PUE66559.1 hypothetical protein B0174_00465 [Arcobacter caeni]